MDRISVVLASDDNYAQHVAVACASVLKNASYPEHIDIYVLSDAIAAAQRSRIEKTVLSLGGHISFIEADSAALQGFVSGHLSKAAYLRLLIPQLLPEHVQKAIYFDTDLVVLDDVETLWNISLQGYPLGAVCDYGIMASKRMRRQKRETIGLSEGKPYFNSGMLVIDTVQWREKQYGQAVIDCISSNQFRHHDQDGLNMIFQNQWLPLPLRWNIIPPVFSLPLKVFLCSDMRKEAVQALKSPAVFHWAGRYKPWEFSVSSLFNSLYYTYLQYTEFKDVSMPQPGKDMKGKSIRRQEWRMKWAHFWTHIL